MFARRMNRRVVGASAAGVAAVFAVAPFAHADPAASPGSSTPSQAADDAGQNAGKAQQPQGQVDPQFGSRKIRVGVQIKDGSWVPPGTTTGNTKIDIVETGPFADQAAALNGTSCRTVEGTQDPGQTETYCEFHGFDSARAAAGVVKPNGVPLEANYLAGPGDTVTFSQTTVNKGLVID